MLNRLKSVFAEVQATREDLYTSGLKGYHIELLMSWSYLARFLQAHPEVQYTITDHANRYLMGVPILICAKCRGGYQVVIAKDKEDKYGR